ncbi:MAG: hypothetical protein ACXAEU_17085 [Candidatus Hodarchaeales archaeon]|jgi:hypothetical protein
MSSPNQALNEVFVNNLASSEGKQKVAEYSGTYIRDKLRESAFSRQILPPANVTKDDCQVSINHDTLVMIEEIEPESRAMTMTFRGQPTARIIRAARTEVPFYTISSEKFEKVQQELLAYKMPITKVIEDNTVKDIQGIEDREFTIHADAAVQALQAEANSVSVAPALNASAIQGASPPIEFAVRKGELAREATSDTAYVWPVQKIDIIDLYKLLDGNELRAQKVLITEREFDDLNQWSVEDVGDKIAGETTVDGYKYSTIVGRAYVRTIKTGVLRPGNIYVFTAPEFLGRFYILNNVQFYIDKIANLVTWQSWEDIAMSLINIASIRKIELYSGDATVNDTDGLVSSFVPKEEAEIGAVNNKVDSGLVFPQVKVY